MLNNDFQYIIVAKEMAKNVCIQYDLNFGKNERIGLKVTKTNHTKT